MESKNQIDIIKFYHGCKIINNIISTNILYSCNKQGKIRIWQGFAAVAPADFTTDKSGAWLTTIKDKLLAPDKFINKLKLPDNYCGIWWTEYGQEGKNITISIPKKIRAGKNIGKLNETTPFTQAVYMLRSNYNTRIRKGASIKKNNLFIDDKITFEKLLIRDVKHPHRINVMLLHSFDKHGKKIKYPCLCQEKIDGAHFTIIYHPQIPGGIDGFTRDKRSYGQKHLLRISKAALKKYPGLYLSGELYLPNKTREYISGKTRLESDESLQLWVFDCFYIDKKMPFLERWDLCKKVVREINSKYFKLVDYRMCNNKKEVDNYFAEKTKSGAEGIIVRNTDSLYEFGITSSKRSHEALKYKKRMDAEFKIVGFTQGVGVNTGLIIWKLETKSGKVFSAVPIGTHEDRKKMFKQQSKKFTAKGKMATVEFDGYSDDGTPVQPVFIMIREVKL